MDGGNFAADKPVGMGKAGGWWLGMVKTHEATSCHLDGKLFCVLDGFGFRIPIRLPQCIGMSKSKLSDTKMGIMNGQDREKLVKASQVAKQLVQDLSALLSSENPLLADITMDILEKAVQVELRIQRLESIDVISRSP